MKKKEEAFMKAMLLKKIRPVSASSQPLEPAEVPMAEPGPGEIRIRVNACGVCHTELDEIEGRTPPPRLPVIPGHQVVGRVEATGLESNRFSPGDRVGVAWIHSACGKCKHCADGNENLCPDFRATGRDVNGGYAEYMTVHQAHAYPIPSVFSDAEAAPLLCAGAIGYRSLHLTGLTDGRRIGLTGFGASAHLVLQMTRHRFPASPVFVFARNEKERAFAKELGAAWAGDTTDTPPEPLDCIIDTTPVWKPVVAALRNLSPGGRLVINAIRKENTDIDCLTTIDYSRHIWMEKEIKSVANITGQDVESFLSLAADANIIPTVETYPLTAANQALIELKSGKIRGAKVLLMEE